MRAVGADTVVVVVSIIAGGKALSSLGEKFSSAGCACGLIGAGSTATIANLAASGCLVESVRAGSNASCLAEGEEGGCTCWAVIAASTVTSSASCVASLANSVVVEGASGALLDTLTVADEEALGAGGAGLSIGADITVGWASGTFALSEELTGDATW